MINTKEYSEAIVEVLDIIKHMDEDVIELIPIEFIKRLNEQKSSTYIANIDYRKPLEENDLKHTTKVLLALIYRDYICTDDEREDFDGILKENENKRYNPNIFENKKESELRLVPVEIKKNIFQKIVDKLFKRV